MEYCEVRGVQTVLEVQAAQWGWQAEHTPLFLKKPVAQVMQVEGLEGLQAKH